MVKKLQWDSEFFDLKVGEISLDTPLDAIEIEEDFDLMYVLSKDDFPLYISEYENTFSETKVFFVKKIEFKFKEYYINLSKEMLISMKNNHNNLKYEKEKSAVALFILINE